MTQELFPRFVDWEREALLKKKFPTLPDKPTVRDYYNERLWVTDPDPRLDLIHPFID